MAKRKAPQDDQQIDPTSEAWRALPWRKFEQHTYRIQKRIYRARQHGKQRTVQKLQKLLMKSEATRLIAVRRVTQENQGKKTAGVDGVKSVRPKDRPEGASRRSGSHPSPRSSLFAPRPQRSEPMQSSSGFRSEVPRPSPVEQVRSSRTPKPVDSLLGGIAPLG